GCAIRPRLPGRDDVEHLPFAAVEEGSADRALLRRAGTGGLRFSAKRELCARPAHGREAQDHRRKPTCNLRATTHPHKTLPSAAAFPDPRCTTPRQLSSNPDRVQVRDVRAKDAATGSDFMM